MEKLVSFDKQGRLYVPEKMRKLLQFKMFVARIQNQGIYLEPIKEDPIKALAELVKGKLKSKSVKQLKKEAREEIEKNVFKKIRRH
jgi:DNA-binding transcriptional regulator/RsmH inhibitor MraZ